MTISLFISTIILIFYLKRVVEELGGNPPIWSALATMGYINEHIRDHGDTKQKRIVKLMYVFFFLTIILILTLLLLVNIRL